MQKEAHQWFRSALYYGLLALLTILLAACSGQPTTELATATAPVAVASLTEATAAPTDNGLSTKHPSTKPVASTAMPTATVKSTKQTEITVSTTVEAQVQVTTQVEKETGASHTRVTSLEDGQEPKEGEWHYVEVNEEGIYAEMIIMITPGDRLFTIYGCSTLKERAITQPMVKIRYPHRLPRELITLEHTLPVQTIVDGNFLSLEWQASVTQDTDIKLTWADAQILVRYIDETNADNYQIVFPRHPELNRVIPTTGLGTAVAETGTECLTNEINEQETQLLMPPKTPQEPVNGLYTYTSPGQRFRFQYPADCGQMWETPTRADNFETCSGNPNDINTSLEIVNFSGMGDALSGSPEWLSKDLADNMAERYGDSTRYNLTTNAGHRLEIAKSKVHEEGEPVTLLAATFTNPQWHLITIYMFYRPETSNLNDGRAETALRTFIAKHP